MHARVPTYRLDPRVPWEELPQYSDDYCEDWGKERRVLNNHRFVCSIGRVHLSTALLLVAYRTQ